MAQPAFKFEIHGLKETMDALEQLPTLSMKKTVVRNALKKSALPVLTKAKANALGIKHFVEPEGKVDIGTVLSKSLKISRSLKKSQRGRADRSRVSMYIGSTHPLAHLFEFGTAQRFTTGHQTKRMKRAGTAPGKAGLYRGFIPPNPFLRQAWDSGKKIALDRLGEELWKALEKAAKMLHKKALKGTLTKGQRAGLR